MARHIYNTFGAHTAAAQGFSVAMWQHFESAENVSKQLFRDWFKARSSTSKWWQGIGIEWDRNRKKKKPAIDFRSERYWLPHAMAYLPNGPGYRCKQTQTKCKRLHKRKLANHFHKQEIMRFPTQCFRHSASPKLTAPVCTHTSYMFYVNG